VLADVGSRYDDLALADIVILNEDDLQEITDIRIVVDNLSYSADTTVC